MTYFFTIFWEKYAECSVIHFWQQDTRKRLCKPSVKMIRVNNKKKLTSNVWPAPFTCHELYVAVKLCSHLRNSIRESGKILQVSWKFWSQVFFGAINSDVLLFFYVEYQHYISYYTIILKSSVVIWQYFLLHCYIVTSSILQAI